MRLSFILTKKEEAAYESHHQEKELIFPTLTFSHVQHLGSWKLENISFRGEDREKARIIDEVYLRQTDRS